MNNSRVKGSAKSNRRRDITYSNTPIARDLNGKTYYLKDKTDDNEVLSILSDTK
jgi:hypothetical protein